MPACPHCATEVSSNARFCRSCGRTTGLEGPPQTQGAPPASPLPPGLVPPQPIPQHLASTPVAPFPYPPGPNLTGSTTSYGSGAPVAWGSSPPPRRRSVPVVLFGVVPVAVLVVVAAVFMNIQKEREEQRRREEQHRQELIAQWTTYESCRDATGSLQRSLERIDSGLSTGDGITFVEFDGLLETARAEYERLPPEQLGQACVGGSAIHLESALNNYISAYNDWLGCIQDYWCTEPDLQTYWSDAASDLSSAGAGLSGLKPNEPDPRDS